jgi:post-segregation antitoxin (ccd killing protein)
VPSFLYARGQDDDAELQQPGQPGQVYPGGVGTFMPQSGVGACGRVYPDSAHVAALDVRRYSGAWCGKALNVTNTQNGKSVVITVADECVTCANANSLDLSVGAFTTIAATAQGQVPISWTLLN